MTKREFLLEGGRFEGVRQSHAGHVRREAASFIVEELVSQASLDEQLI